MPDAPEPTCPSCGYSRTGIAADALCPECGADGLSGAVVLLGQSRASESLLLPVLLIASFVTLVTAAGVVFPLIGFAGPRPHAGQVVFLVFLIALVVLLGLAVSGRIQIERVPAFRARQIVWTIHARGVEIREGDRHDRIAREEITDLRCSESLVGEVSVLQLVRRRSSVKGVIGVTPYLYIRGPHASRQKEWRSARRALGIS